MNIGFIGLGVMGAPMAGHLIAGGHKVFLHSRRGAPEALRNAGGVAAANAAEVARQSEVIILMVPDTPDVETVLFGADGVAEGLTRGKVVVDMSSISPIATKQFAARIEALGCDYVDARAAKSAPRRRRVPSWSARATRPSRACGRSLR